MMRRGLWGCLAVWMLVGAGSLSILSWHHHLNPHLSLKEEVQSYFLHWIGGIIPAGILILYLPYFIACYLVLKRGASLRLVVGMCVLLRLVMLPGLPILETDHYRYLWDGLVWSGGHNPYRYAPGQIKSAQLGWDESIPADLKELAAVTRSRPLHTLILSEVNNPGVPTIYFPSAQYLFGVTGWLIRGLELLVQRTGTISLELQVALAILLWKMVLFPFELGVLYFILCLLRRLNKPDSWLLIYGWSPLVLKEYGNTAHFDPLVLFFLLWGLLGILRTIDPPSLKQQLGGMAAMAISTAGKLFPLIYLPLLGWWLDGRGWMVFVLVLVAVFVPFLSVGGDLFTGLATYSNRWEFNSSLVGFLEWFISFLQDWYRGMPVPPQGEADPATPLLIWSGVEFHLNAFFLAKVLCGSLFLWFLLDYSHRLYLKKMEGGDPALLLCQGCFMLTGALLLLSPVTDPWYVCWIIPFLSLFPNRAWLFLTFSQQIYYLYFWNGHAYLKLSDLPGLQSGLDWEIGRPLEYIPFYVCLVWDWFHNKKQALG